MLFSLGLQKTENINYWYTALDLAYVHMWARVPWPVLLTVKTAILAGRNLKPTTMIKWSTSVEPITCAQVMNYAKLQLQGNKIITRWHEVNRWQKLFLWSCMSINWQKTYSLCDSEKFWANDRENSQIFSCKTGTSLTQKSDIRSRLWWADS